MTERSEIVIGDGVPRMVVERVEDGKVATRARARGMLGPRKGINVTYAMPTLPAITAKDVADLAVAVDEGACAPGRGRCDAHPGRARDRGAAAL